ncbi:monocarboxylate transporter 6-like [Cydia amplana]|uniref:monocarboxylate transporter 6-like n=1 Tax=Cydia amplana TaxID=1869771 RepID=UPI002FE5A921
MLWISDYSSVLIILGVMGISRCIIIVMYALVVADYVRPEQFPSAFGLSMAIYGVASISCGPIIGAIRDATNNYTIMFWILIAIFTASTTAWAIEMFREWRRQKREIQRNN